MPHRVKPPITPIHASSAIITANLLLDMAKNILASSGTLDSSSATSYCNQLLGASSTVDLLITQSQLGYKFSS